MAMGRVNYEPTAAAPATLGFIATRTPSGYGVFTSA